MPNNCRPILLLFTTVYRPHAHKYNLFLLDFEHRRREDRHTQTQHRTRPDSNRTHTHTQRLLQLSHTLAFIVFSPHDGGGCDVTYAGCTRYGAGLAVVGKTAAAGRWWLAECGADTVPFTTAAVQASSEKNGCDAAAKCAMDDVDAAALLLAAAPAPPPPPPLVGCFIR